MTVTEDTFGVPSWANFGHERQHHTISGFRALVNTKPQRPTLSNCLAVDSTKCQNGLLTFLGTLFSFHLTHCATTAIESLAISNITCTFKLWDCVCNGVMISVNVFQTCVQINLLLLPSSPCTTVGSFIILSFNLHYTTRWCEARKIILRARLSRCINK